MNKFYKYIFIIIFINLIIILAKNNSLGKKYYYTKKLIEEIAKVYNAFHKVNINEIDKKINKIEYFSPTKFNSVINIGITLDRNFILETMLTITSILATQHKATKINFHFGVSKNFDFKSMAKIYELRYKINTLSEFNFYYLRESVLKMKNFHSKGEALVGRVELPNYLSDEIEKLLFFDVGDLLVLRDLTELYNYDMGQFWVLGIPEPSIINSFTKPFYNTSKYINTGSMLLNIKKLKENRFWDNYVKNRNIPLKGDNAQTLFNVLLPDDKKNYLPFNFGGYCLFNNDNNYDVLRTADFDFNNWFNSNLSLTLPNNPKSLNGILSQLYNPRYIHQFYGKWSNGEGLSIYRHLAKYFMLLTGLYDEFCSKKPGYCL